MKRFKNTRSARIGLIWVVLIALCGGYASTQTGHGAIAAPQIVGNPEGQTQRLAVLDGSKIVRIVYYAAGAHTPVSGTTPEASDPTCGLAGDLHMLELDFTGTMTGTSPTLNVAFQNSADGTTWYNVGTAVPLNSTSITTPANLNQRISVADVKNGTSSTAYGGCWRAQLTYGGSGSIGGNFGIVGVEK